MFFANKTAAALFIDEFSSRLSFRNKEIVSEVSTDSGIRPLLIPIRIVLTISSVDKSSMDRLLGNDSHRWRMSSR